MVKAASSMFRAISFGVFWRLAPSIRPIIRSRKPSPGLAVTLHDQPVGQEPRPAGDRAPIAARFADDRRAFTGHRAFIYRSDALCNLAVRRKEVASFDQVIVTLAEQRSS